MTQFLLQLGATFGFQQQYRGEFAAACCWPKWRVVAGIFAMISATGCQPATAPNAAANAGQEPETQVAIASTDSRHAIGERQSAGCEVWEAVFIQGGQVGFNHNTIRRVESGPQTRWEIESVNQIVIRRFGEQSIAYTRTLSVEDDDGRVESIEIETRLGAQPNHFRGRVRGDRLELQSQSDGRSTTSTIPWPNDCRGFLGVEQSLEQQPLKPGEQRRIKVFLPVLNAPGDVKLTAIGKERVLLLDGESELLRVDMQIRLPQGTTLDSMLWVDEQGQTLKTRMQAVGQETYRSSRERALSVSTRSGAVFDLGVDAIVKLARPLVNPHDRRARRYRVTLDGGDPAVEFRNADYQEVKPLDAHQAEVVVRPSSPATTPGNEPPTAADREPNEWIQSDDPRIIRLAEQGRGSETDPWRICLALETFVHRAIDDVNFSTAFSSAVEVAETRQGDCTEHAVLLAALARANGIPTRVAIGLVYVDRYQGFGYHMWTEVNVNDRWLPLDATLGRGGIGGGHLKLSDTSLAGGGALESLLPVAKILGRVAIEVIDDGAR